MRENDKPMTLLGRERLVQGYCWFNPVLTLGCNQSQLVHELAGCNWEQAQKQFEATNSDMDSWYEMGIRLVG